MTRPDPRAIVRARLADETGTIVKEAQTRVALVYPSPYATAMSSLGFQQIYRLLNQRADVVAERAFLPDADSSAGDAQLATYETGRAVADFPIVALSVAFELEVAGVIRVLEAARLPALTVDRTDHHPLVIAGGPLTFSNPWPLTPFVDALVLGEADELIHVVIDTIAAAPTKRAARERLAALPSVHVPGISGDSLPPVAKAEDARLPAYAAIRTPNTELRSMFLIEAERGCSRGCTYCVMRRSTNGGMRLVPIETILSHVPEDAKRVGLVGAAVSDHPRIVTLLDALCARGIGVGLSSLRPDRLTEPLVAALARAGHQTLTTAMDGASERLMASIQRGAKVRHLERAAELARQHRLKRLKLYLMVGLPDETDADIDELAALARKLSKVIPLSFGVAPFVAKRNTPLDGQPFAGIDVVEARLARLRSALKGRAELRPISARWAWVEHRLAQGGPAAGLAVLEAVRRGGKFSHYREALAAIGT
ncbi:MAG: radical SAM protein [Deltaproteobacteria bacterium]|nr:radical SAM protein [Deltaproteobacteria bacterium]